MSMRVSVKRVGRKLIQARRPASRSHELREILGKLSGESRRCIARCKRVDRAIESGTIHEILKKALMVRMDIPNRSSCVARLSNIFTTYPQLLKAYAKIRVIGDDNTHLFGVLGDALVMNHAVDTIELLHEFGHHPYNTPKQFRGLVLQYNIRRLLEQQDMISKLIPIARLAGVPAAIEEQRRQARQANAAMWGALGEMREPGESKEMETRKAALKKDLHELFHSVKGEALAEFQATLYMLTHYSTEGDVIQELGRRGMKDWVDELPTIDYPHVSGMYIALNFFAECKERKVPPWEAYGGMGISDFDKRMDNFVEHAAGCLEKAGYSWRKARILEWDMFARERATTP